MFVTFRYCLFTLVNFFPQREAYPDSYISKALRGDS